MKILFPLFHSKELAFDVPDKCSTDGQIVKEGSQVAGGDWSSLSRSMPSEKRKLGSWELGAGIKEPGNWEQGARNMGIAISTGPVELLRLIKYHRRMGWRLQMEFWSNAAVR